eukprot:Em0012g1086a
MCSRSICALAGNKSCSALCLEEASQSPARHTAEDGAKRPSTAPASPLAGRSLIQTRREALQSGVSKRQPSSRSQRLKTRKPSPHLSVLTQMPGYTLSRSPKNIHMEINTDVFFGTTTTPPIQNTQKAAKPTSEVVQVPSPSQKTPALDERVSEESIKQQANLQRELSEMSVKLEQQKEQWEVAMKELEATFQKERISINSHHDNQLSSLKNSHLSELQALREEHIQELEELKNTETLQRGSLAGELEFLRELLETTKMELTEEANRRVMETKTTLLDTHNEELKRLEQLTRDKADQQLVEVVTKLENKHTQQQEALREAHTHEMNTLLSQFSDSAELQDKLTEANQHSEALEKEVSRLKEVLQSITSEQLNTEAELLDTRKKLADLERAFAEQVHEVDTRYRDRMDGLMRQNADLRKHALQTSMEYCQYRANVQRARVPLSTSVRERMRAVVQARSTAKLGVALGLDEQEGNRPRPLSAPETHGERKLAKELSKEHNVQELRPLSCMPHFH